MNFGVDGGVSSSCECRARCARAMYTYIICRRVWDWYFGRPHARGTRHQQTSRHRRELRANIKCVCYGVVPIWKRSIPPFACSKARWYEAALIGCPSANCSWNPNVVVLWYILSITSNHFDGRTHVLLILVDFSTGRTVLLVAEIVGCLIDFAIRRF